MVLKNWNNLILGSSSYKFFCKNKNEFVYSLYLVQKDFLEIINESNLTYKYLLLSLGL
jgi:hypothetical protein